MSCCAKAPPLLENPTPVSNITKAPSSTKHMPRTIVVKKPTLKSKRLCLTVRFFILFFFSSDHNECHTDISRGPGIQPIKAIKNAKPVVDVGRTCVHSISLDCPNARKAAIRVLMLSTMIMIFMPRSNSP